MKNYFALFVLVIAISCSSALSNSNGDNLQIAANTKTDTSKSIMHKKFKEADNTAVFTTKFVIVDHKDITEVHHDEDDGAWQFFSADKFDDFTKVAKLVGLGQITKLDSTIFEIADMPMGYIAHRKFKGDKWVIKKK